MKTEWTTDTYEAGNDYDQTRIMTSENEDVLVEMTEAEVNMLVNAVDNPSGKMPTSTHIVTARRISEIISGVWEKIKAALSKKVDKVEGKGLSTNDFTTVDKNRLDEAWGAAHTHSNKSILDNITAPYTTEEKTKLAGIEASAQVNVQSDWEQSDSAADDFIKNKPAELAIAAGEGIGITEANNTLTISVSADYAADDDINFLSGAIDGKVATTAFNGAIEEINDTFEEIGDDINFLSGAIDGIPSQVQSDWAEDDSTKPSYIQNKPAELSLAAGNGIGITETAGNIEISVSADYARSADVASTYYLKSNPDNYEENIISAVKIAGTSMTVSNKSVNFDMIPSSADSSHPLVTTTDLAAALANFGGFKVSTGTGTDLHPDEQNPDTKTIYLVKDSSTAGSDKYKEWICTNTTAPVTWELIGDTSMDLAGYVQFPASYTAGNIVTFGTNSIADSTYTTADVVNVQPDWEQSSTAAYDYIKNKPEQMTLTGGSYIDITTASNQLTIDANITNISGAMTGYANVQADWNETVTANASYIQNKPDIIIPQVGAGVTDVPKYIMVVTAMPPAAQIDPNTIYLVQGTYIGN